MRPDSFDINDHIQYAVKDPSDKLNNIPISGQTYSVHIHPRVLFLRKLYFMLFIQWSIVSLLTFFAWLFTDFKNFLGMRWWLIIIFAGSAVILALVTFFLRKAMRYFPVNLIVYLLFTASLALSFAWLVVWYNSEVALMIVVLTNTVFLALFVHILCVEKELSYQGVSIFILASVLIIFQLFLIFTELGFGIMIAVIVGVVVWAFYVIFDAETLISGSKYDWHKNDEWISGAVVIYSDVFYLFLRVFELFRQLLFRERN